MEGYGHFELDCVKCAEKWLVALALLAGTIWMLIATYIAVEGNLSDASNQQAANAPLLESDAAEEAREAAKRNVTESIKVLRYLCFL